MYKNIGDDIFKTISSIQETGSKKMLLTENQAKVVAEVVASWIDNEMGIYVDEYEEEQQALAIRSKANDLTGNTEQR